MSNGAFWNINVWGLLILFGTLLLSMLFSNLIKKSVPFLKRSLVPTSVLGGLILLVIATIYKSITGTNLFNTTIFGGNGLNTLEIITYHGLGLGFVAMTLSSRTKKFSSSRKVEIFNTGVTTVSTYLIQAVFGLIIAFIFLYVGTKILPASGILLAFGFGQGTGQAMNYGTIYQNDYGFIGGTSFGLTIAALGFLSASIGGVIYLNILKKKNKINVSDQEVVKALNLEEVQNEDEIPMNGSIDKLTVQIGIIIAVYLLAFVFMYGLGYLVNGVRSILFGFNFLIGVLFATIIKKILDLLKKKNIVKKQYINSFLMNRLGGFFFDVMIVAGIAAIQIDLIKDYWLVLLIMALFGAFITFFYVRFVCKKLYGNYFYEQFFAMYGMLTGTASTGIILLREIDPNFETPAADNLVFQNLPAIVFGFPMMLLASYAPKSNETAFITLVICTLFFIVMNLILFRSFIFKKKNNEQKSIIE